MDGDVGYGAETGWRRCRTAFGNIARRHLNATRHIDQNPHVRAGHHPDLARSAVARAKHDVKMLAFRVEAEALAPAALLPIEFRVRLAR